jgi:hypothetical protein
LDGKLITPCLKKKREMDVVGIVAEVSDSLKPPE